MSWPGLSVERRARADARGALHARQQRRRRRDDDARGAGGERVQRAGARRGDADVRRQPAIRIDLVRRKRQHRRGRAAVADSPSSAARKKRTSADGLLEVAVARHARTSVGRSRGSARAPAAAHRTKRLAAGRRSRPGSTARPGSVHACSRATRRSSSTRAEIERRGRTDHEASSASVPTRSRSGRRSCRGLTGSDSGTRPGQRRRRTCGRVLNAEPGRTWNATSPVENVPAGGAGGRCRRRVSGDFTRNV